MENSCFVENCAKFVNFKCECFKTLTFMCKDHSNFHCENPGPHKLVCILTQIDHATKADFLKKNYERRQFISSLKAKLISETSELINIISRNTNNAMAKLIIEEDRILRSQEMAREDNKIPTDEYLKYLNHEECDLTLDLSLFNISTLEHYLDEYYSKSFLSALKTVQSVNSLSFTKSMVFFMRNSNTMINIDIGKLVMSKAKVELDNCLGSHAGWCRLPSNKIFHYGGQTSNFHKPLNCCYVIDTLSNTADKRLDGPVRKYAIGTLAYLDRCVYIFGGASTLGGLVSDSERYDINGNQWTILQPLPTSSDYNTTVVNGMDIVITGYRLGILIYLVGKNIYKEEIPNKEGQKIMFSEGENIYILHSGALLERSNGAWACINKTTHIPDDPYLVSYPVRSGNFIYFLLSNETMYRFDLINKSLERVKQFNIS